MSGLWDSSEQSAAQQVNVRHEKLQWVCSPQWRHPPQTNSRVWDGHATHSESQVDDGTLFCKEFWSNSSNTEIFEKCFTHWQDEEGCLSSPTDLLPESVCLPPRSPMKLPSHSLCSPRLVPAAPEAGPAPEGPALAQRLHSLFTHPEWNAFLERPLSTSWFLLSSPDTQPTPANEWGRSVFMFIEWNSGASWADSLFPKLFWQPCLLTSRKSERNALTCL